MFSSEKVVANKIAEIYKLDNTASTNAQITTFKNSWSY